MATFLLIVIYLAFISLGLPDSALGAAWPVAHLDLGVSYAAAGAVGVVVTFGTVLSSLLSTRLIARYGTGRVTAGCVLLTAAALLGYSVSDKYWMLCLLAAPLGLGGGAIDVALNNFVALHYKAIHMEFLHCFWGVGATMGPVILSAFLRNGGNWHGGYRTLGLIQAALALVMLASLPLWKRVERRNAAETGAIEVSYRQVLRLPGAKAAMLSFFLYCAAEMTAGLWASTYFVECWGMAAEKAARWGALFYFGLTAGRAASGLLTLRLSDDQLIHGGQAAAACGALLMLIPGGDGFRLAGFLLFGLGCAPMYPSMLHATPAHFGVGASQAMFGLQMASAYVGCTVMPPLFGLLGQSVSFRFLPYLLLAYTAALYAATRFVGRHARAGKENGWTEA